MVSAVGDLDPLDARPARAALGDHHARATDQASRAGTADAHPPCRRRLERQQTRVLGHAAAGSVRPRRPEDAQAIPRAPDDPCFLDRAIAGLALREPLSSVSIRACSPSTLRRPGRRPAINVLAGRTLCATGVGGRTEQAGYLLGSYEIAQTNTSPGDELAFGRRSRHRRRQPYREALARVTPTTVQAGGPQLLHAQCVRSPSSDARFGAGGARPAPAMLRQARRNGRDSR